MSPLSFVVIANCQARPISVAIEAMAAGGCRSLGTIITHLARDLDLQANVDLLEKADLIFAQRVDETFPVEHVITKKIKDRFGDKVITWPNIFFTGQTPGLCYVSGAKSQRIRGPLHEYQYQPMFESWANGLSVKECIQRIECRSSNTTEQLMRLICKSLDELKVREQGLDVIASDLIERDWQSKHLFFTFNHPTSNLLLPIAQRLLAHAGIFCDIQMAAQGFGEPLNRIMPPISDADASALNLGFETSFVSKGVEVILANGTVTLGKSRVYPMNELVDVGYRALDYQKNLIDNVRITPV